MTITEDTIKELTHYLSRRIDPITFEVVKGHDFEGEPCIFVNMLEGFPRRTINEIPFEWGNTTVNLRNKCSASQVQKNNHTSMFTE